MKNTFLHHSMSLSPVQKGLVLIKSVLHPKALSSVDLTSGGTDTFADSKFLTVLDLTLIKRRISTSYSLLLHMDSLPPLYCLFNILKALRPSVQYACHGRKRIHRRTLSRNQYIACFYAYPTYLLPHPIRIHRPRSLIAYVMRHQRRPIHPY